jgi:hypothetical protein
MAASLVNANVLLIDLELSKTIQIVGAIITLTILASAGIGFTLRGQWVIPAVLGWASLAIAVQLSDPTNVAMVERFPSAAVAGIEFAAGGLAAFLLPESIFSNVTTTLTLKTTQITTTTT